MGRHRHVILCGSCGHLLSGHGAPTTGGPWTCGCGCVFHDGDEERPLCEVVGTCTHDSYDQWRPASNGRKAQP